MTNPHTTIIDLRIPFVRLTFFFVKSALAMIAAMFILSMLAALALAILHVLSRVLSRGGSDIFETIWRQIPM